MVLRVSGGASGQDAAAPSARPPKPAPANNLTSEETFQALIEDLGSSQFARRESAADALRLGGQSALKALRRAQNHPDAEVRRRAAELQGPLEASLRLAPKRVSLERKSRTLRATLEEISKSTGYTVEAWNNLEQQVDFGCDNITLLEAVDQLGRLTGTVLQQGYGDDRIRLGAGNCPRWLPTMAPSAWWPHLCSSTETSIWPTPILAALALPSRAPAAPKPLLWAWPFSASPAFPFWG